MKQTTHRRQDRRNNSERGSIIIVAALSVAVLMAFTGLALDATYMYFHKRRMQTAADAGAYAGALERLRGSADIATAAQKDTALNGFQNGVGDVTVEVNNPPLSGSKIGDPNFIEVIVSHAHPTWFMRVVNFNSVMVKARAVAGLGNTNNGCVFALNQDSSVSTNGIFVNGTTESRMNCGVYSNANFKGSGGGCLVAPSINYMGDYTNQNSNGECGPTGIGRGIPVVDPMRNRYSIPSYGGCTANNFKITGGTTVTVTPGTYCGGISISGSVENVIFSPGAYILVGGGLKINGSVNISGSDVTFYNTFPGSRSNQYDGVSITTTGTVNLAAPTAGSSKGLLFYQDPRVAWTASNGSYFAGTNAVYTGILYFPSTDMQYSGSSTTSSEGTDGYTMLIGYNIKVNGSAKINSDYTAIGGYPFQNALFAE